MKAVQMIGYGATDQLRYVEVPLPILGAGQVLVKLGATSVNPIDWKIRRGDRKTTNPLQLPVTIGRDIAGTVSEVAPGPLAFKPGQRVMAVGNHAFAEFVAVASSALAPMPDGLDMEQAGALPLVVSTGAELMERLEPCSGMTVLVTGALGGVGRTALYVASQAGARVIAGVRARQKTQAQALGAMEIVALDSAAEIAGLPQLDAIADTVSGEVIQQLLPKLRRGGVLGSVLGKPAAAEGMDIRVEAVVARPNAARLERMAVAVRRGKLAIPIARRFKLSEAAAAQQLAEGGHIDGKVVLVP